MTVITYSVGQSLHNFQASIQQEGGSMENYINENGYKSAPIGLYFASLWYNEKMYPVTSYLEALSRAEEQLSAK